MDTRISHDTSSGSALNWARPEQCIDDDDISYGGYDDTFYGGYDDISYGGRKLKSRKAQK